MNKIKANSLNDRLFRELCHENDEVFERLLLHTEVRWLSKGNCLWRFYHLIDTVIEFLESTDSSLSTSVKERRMDSAYLSDIFDKLNEINTKLQGQKINFIKSKGIICAFIDKLGLFKSNMCRKDLFQFPGLQVLWKESKPSPDDLKIYSSHLEQLKEDMETRFQDLTALKRVFNPFSVDVTTTENIPHSLHESLIDLQHDKESRSVFTDLGYEVFWVKKRKSYPLLWEEIKILHLCFPSTYLVEKGFSVVTILKTKARNRLQITQRGDLRLNLTTMSPDIIHLCESHQAQSSH